ncbi:hypothetical protein VIGAN_03037100 [Vigna angularis var. angularis]|uniref:Uncharacterized protein n=1 Tax=Vigna angularis var. angularis TaxID=157739 RepID=A0A0S3RJJ0_PHAAN|nr:hypothetical protein VIGAN_03037100 [Vigna angularis var. angularis]
MTPSSAITCSSSSLPSNFDSLCFSWIQRICSGLHFIEYWDRVGCLGCFNDKDVFAVPSIKVSKLNSAFLTFLNSSSLKLWSQSWFSSRF